MSVIVRVVALVRFVLTLSVIGSVAASAVASPADGILSGYSLTSWNDGAGKKAIVDLVQATTQGNAKFVPAGYPSSKERAK